MELSVIIVEYKDMPSVRRAIESVRQNCSAFSIEIIVISNSQYPPAQQARLQSVFSDVRTCFNDDNIGFGRAINQGLEASSGRFVLLLNPDAMLLGNNIAHGLEFMNTKPQVACIGPMIVDESGSVQDSCRNFMTPLIWLQRMLTRFKRQKPGGVLELKDHTVVKAVDWVSGACILVRAAAVEAVGMMDERYFMYLEDMDWCRTFWRQGWEVWYLPSWKILHLAERGSTSGFNIANRLMWIHIMSMCRYYFKWGIGAERTYRG